MKQNQNRRYGIWKDAGSRRINWHRLWAGALAAAVGLGAAPASAKEADTAAGRYLETEVELPENFEISSIVCKEDGMLRIIGRDAEAKIVMWDSGDGGESWEMAASLPEEYKDLYLVDMTLAPDGGGAAVAIENTEDIDSMTYAFVSFDAQGNAQKTPAEDGGPGLLEFTQQGELLGMIYGGALSVLDRTTGETIRQISDMQGEMIGVCGDEVLLLANEAQRYRIDDGEPLSRDESLNEALYGDGQSYVASTSQGHPIVFAQDCENRLYYCTNQGIFSHTMEGGVVEQAVDGTLTSLCMPDVALKRMAVQDQCFYVAYADMAAMSSGLWKYEYSEDVPSTPEKELTIWSLEEDDGIRQAAVQFQKQHPDTYVHCQTGMSGEDGMTAADALRTLNTDILAGNGPDLLVLDGLSVETYEEKGMLAELSDLLSDVKESDGLLENITDAYRTEDGAVYAVPVKFSMEVAAGAPEFLEGIDGFEALVKLAEQTDVLTPVDVCYLAETLYPVCAGSWEKEDRTIDQEKLAEYVHGIKAVTDAYLASASEKNLEEVQNYKDEVYALWDMVGAEQEGMVLGTIDLFTGEAKVKLGALGDFISGFTGLSTIKEQTGNGEISLLSMQQSNVFLPICTVGILSTAEEPECAAEFVRYMLSEDGQRSNSSVGLPVNQKAFDALLSENPFGEEGGYGISTSDGEGNFVDLEYSWPSDEAMEEFRSLVEQLSVCAETGAVQRETVLTEIHRCLDGEISADEAVNSIMQKMNLYLAEQGGR